MKISKMQELWDSWSENWYQKATIDVNGVETSVAVLCEIKKGYSRIIYHRYNKIKKIFKKSYFYKRHDNISRYKRAAIIAYAISAAEPLFYRNLPEGQMDDCYLKQRLAFHVAIGSIIQDFPEYAIKAVNKDGKVFDFDALGEIDRIFDRLNNEQDSRDDFRLSVYKDLFFAEIYENYNILTMANVFGLLTEKSSILRGALEFHEASLRQNQNSPNTAQNQEPENSNTSESSENSAP